MRLALREQGKNDLNKLSNSSRMLWSDISDEDDQERIRSTG
jgi:hypothetical protein